MERKPGLLSGDFSQSLLQQEQEVKIKRIKDLIWHSHYQLRFFIVWQSEHVVSVGIKGRYYGIRLFDANSNWEINTLKEEGLEVVESPTDLILEGETATVSEVEIKLPQFLAKYYPQIFSSMSPQSLKIEEKEPFLLSQQLKHI